MIFDQIMTKAEFEMKLQGQSASYRDNYLDIWVYFCFDDQAYGYHVLKQGPGTTAHLNQHGQ